MVALAPALSNALAMSMAMSSSFSTTRIDSPRPTTTTTSSDDEPCTSAEDAGHLDEDAEEQEDRTGSEPSEDNESIVHGTAPASSLPTDPKDNEPQVPEVPPAANDNVAPIELPATSTEMPPNHVSNPIQEQCIANRVVCWVQ